MKNLKVEHFLLIFCFCSMIVIPLILKGLTDNWINRFTTWFNEVVHRITGYLSNRFGTKTKTVAGRIIALKEKKIIIPYQSFNFDESPNLINFCDKPPASTKYFAFLEEKEVGKYHIEINSETFKKLKERKKFLSKELTTFYLKKYLLFGFIFEQFYFQFDEPSADLIQRDRFEVELVY